jgi:hypothetical protein
MKTIRIFKTAKIACLALAAIGLTAGSSHAQTVIGSWQGSGDDGWIDWGNGQSITSPANMPSPYSFANAGVPGYSQSLQLSKSGWSQDLSIKLEYTPGDVAAFLNNQLFSITWSIPAGTGGGYEQMWGLYLNATGIGWTGPLSASTVSITGNGSVSGTGGELDFWSGSPMQTQTITWNYSSYLSSITATPSSGYVELVLTSNSGGGAPGIFDFNNAELSGGPVPEPATGVLALTGGVLAIFWMRRCSKPNA